jgi:hypothetical protein
MIPVSFFRRNGVWNKGVLTCIVAVTCLAGLLSISVSFCSTDSFSVYILTDYLFSECDSDDDTDGNLHRIDGSVAVPGIAQLNIAAPIHVLFFLTNISIHTTRYLSLSAGRSPPFSM